MKNTEANSRLVGGYVDYFQLLILEYKLLLRCRSTLRVLYHDNQMDNITSKTFTQIIIK